MKKLIALLLALMMAFTLAACGGEDDTPSGGNNDDKTPSSSQPQNTPDPGADEPDDTHAPDEGFAMPTLNSYDDFPPADYWTALGLPSDFTIEITEMEYSSKNSIYPLNAKDGNMFDCVVSDNKAAYTALADALWNAGIKGVSADGAEASERSEVDIYDIDVHVYHAYWQLDGELMSIEVRARDGSNRVSVTVKYAPED